MRLRWVIALSAMASFSGCSSCIRHRSSSDSVDLPAAPASLTAAALTSGSIQLGWIDASSNEDGFRVERSTNGASWTEVVFPAADATSCVSRGLAPSTKYYFRIRSWNAGGYSAYEGIANATTKSVAWTILPSSPSARMLHAAVYDPAAPQRMMMFAGFDGNGLQNDVLALPLAGGGGWTDLSPAAGPPAPSPRVGCTAILDNLNNRMIVFGGSPVPGENEVWALNLSPVPYWELLLPGSISFSAPAPRFGHTAVYDPPNQRMIVFGGNNGGQTLNDTWALSLPSGAGATWSLLTAFGSAPPPPRENHAAVYDSVGARMIVFGGIDNDLFWDGSVNSNGCWTLALPPGGGPTSWSALATSGPRPSHRERHSLIYDSVNERLIVFGGLDDTFPSPRGDVWTLGLTGTPAWSQAFPLGAFPPSPRVSHTAIHDPYYGRMILFGGDDDTFTPFSDAWALEL